MQLQFCGANRQVTGSCYLLEAGGQRILIDCGLFQERKYQSRNWDPFPFKPESIDVMLLTHAHLDHCGLIPKLVREGFSGKIYTTEPSVELASIVMLDSAKIHEEDAAYKIKRHKREKRKPPRPVVPLYTVDDAKKAIAHLEPIAFNACHRLADGVEVCFHDAGHVLGSAMLTIDVDGDGKDNSKKRLLFSGDIGQRDKPLIPDPTLIERADIVIMESTYGDREHREEGDVETKLAEAVNEAYDAGGNVVIPTFAIERAQELLFHLSQLLRAKRIPRVPVFLDSPMAIRVTDLFAKHRSFLDAQAQAMLDADNHPLEFPGLYLSKSADESRAINGVRGTAIILAGSGMCTGGRIKHHLGHNIARPESTLLFVGYQSPDTLGGLIVRGRDEVRIYRRNYPVYANVRQLHGLSAHADHEALLHWLDAVSPRPQQVFLTHGEEDVAEKLAEELRTTRGLNVEVPHYSQTVTL